MRLEDLPKNKPLPVKKGFRHLAVFQLKLLADALRDLLLSPISLFAFIIDAVTKPTVKESLSYRLMLAGRRSDRMINLFDEHSGSEAFTIDATVAEVEMAVQRELKKRKELGSQGSSD